MEIYKKAEKFVIENLRKEGNQNDIFMRKGLFIGLSN